MIRIGLDAMGGDFAPEVVVKGAVMALDAIAEDCRIVLFGDKEEIRSILAKEGCSTDRFEIVATSEIIEMGDHPVRAFQQKPNSSIAVGFRHLAEGEIDGLASAGSTGAVMVGSTQVVKAIEGVIRPAISTLIPTTAGRSALLLDVGLNIDCKADVLEQYALIGSVYAKSVLGIEKPRVALLNIGTEPTKGNLQIRAAYELLQLGSEAGKYNFVGNVEASHIFTSEVADVIVCDGFVGNTILKLSEGLYSINAQHGHTNSFWEGLNYEHTGGTPVLGINAPVILGHGKSTAQAIKSMVLATEHAIRSNIVEHLQEAFK
ncbi:MAG: phosphate acyltransferase PlsX [Rikenellaceae bacterium]|nr:phosphate acyltransferase PlsX [Rikenellaceae bacterium]